jgi:hypothetical protein
VHRIQDLTSQRESRSRTIASLERTISKLKHSLVEHTISLMAAQARETAAREVRTQAIRYIELEEYTREGPQKLREASLSLNPDRLRLKRLNERITNQIKPGVIDNKVTLYKITEDPEN